MMNVKLKSISIIFCLLLIVTCSAQTLEAIKSKQPPNVFIPTQGQINNSNLTSFSLIDAHGTNVASTNYYLNGQLVSAERMELIAPNNIKEIEIKRTGDTIQFRVNTKAILFLTYKDLKTQAGAVESSHPKIMVDTKWYNDEIVIDKKLIRRIKLIEGDTTTILIRTILYKKKKKGKDYPLTIIRGNSYAN